MEIKDKYTFEDIDNFEEEIQRIIYWWRRYEGTRAQEGKDVENYELANLVDRINKYMKDPEKFNWDNPTMDEDE